MKASLIFLLVFSGILSIAFAYPFVFPSANQTSFKIGLVYSTTGFRTMKEKAALEAGLLAIDQINQKGGVLGKKLVPYVKNAHSNWDLAKKGIEELINEEHVDVIVGCWTKASLYTIKPLFEKHNTLLIYPFQYEGIITSPNIIWLGAALNQQVMPAIAYCLKNKWNSVYLIGSDYIIPHTINILARDQLQVFGGEVLGERYLALEENNEQAYDKIIKEILEKKPDVILSSIFGQTNSLFFKKLTDSGAKTTVISFSLDEVFLQELDAKELTGIYAVWNYFQSIPTLENQKFVSEYKKFSGSKAVDNAAEASYFGIFLWAKAVEEAGTTNVKNLKYVLPSLRVEAPEGPVTMDVEGRRAWKFARIGKIEDNGQFKIMWESKSPIRPMPFQIHRSQVEWEELTDYLYREFADLTPRR